MMMTPDEKDYGIQGFWKAFVLNVSRCPESPIADDVKMLPTLYWKELPKEMIELSLSQKWKIKYLY